MLVIIVPVRQIINYILRLSVILGFFFFGSHKEYGFHVFIELRNNYCKNEFDVRFACKKSHANVCSCALYLNGVK